MTIWSVSHCTFVVEKFLSNESIVARFRAWFDFPPPKNVARGRVFVEGSPRDAAQELEISCESHHSWTTRIMSL